MNQLVGPLFRPISRWAENSQRTACRNAMVASTALAAGRRERDEAQDFVAAMLAERPRQAGSTAPSVPAAQLG